MPSSRRKGGFYYAVKRGKTPGVYGCWSDCEDQVRGFPDARYKKFETQEEAEIFAYGESSSLPLPRLASSTTGRFSYAPYRYPHPQNTISNSGNSYRCPTWRLSRPAAPGQFESRILTSFIYDESPSHSHVLHQAASTSSAKYDQPQSPVTASVSVNGSPADSQPQITGYSEEKMADPRGVLEQAWDVVYTAGICEDTESSGPVAGIGAWWAPQDSRNFAERCPGKQRKKLAELMSILRLLERTEITTKPLLIRTASEYCIRCFKTRAKVWKDNNWLNSRGRPVKNGDVIRCILKYLEVRANFGQQVVIAYVNCRTGDVGNDGARALANQGALSLPVRIELDRAGLEEILECQLNRTIIGLGRKVEETEILGPQDISDNVLIEMRTKDRTVSVVHRIPV